MSEIRVTIRDGKEPTVLGFCSVQVLTKVRVRFGLTLSSSQVQKIWVHFGFGSSVLSSVRFYMSSAV